MSDTEVTYKIGWVASVDDGGNSREVVVDAFSGATLATESLVVHADYSRSGTVSGLVYPRNYFDTRADLTFENLKVQAVNLVGQIMDTDETDSDGDYDLNWSGATATYLVGAELEGQYVKSVSDEDNTDLEHWPRFSTPYTATYDWTWPNDIQYADQLNIFFHTNKMARWYESNLYNVTHKVKLVANKNIGSPHAQTVPGSIPRIEFSDAVDSERQADTIYHEYVHSVSYKLHGRFIGTSGQGLALEEGMAFYFAQTLIGSPNQRVAGSNFVFELNPFVENRYPTDYNSTTSEHERGLIPAGAAWDLRIDLGATQADKIVFAALEMDSPRANTFEEFFDNVLLADDDLYGNGTWNWPGCGYGWGDSCASTRRAWSSHSSSACFGSTDGTANT